MKKNVWISTAERMPTQGQDVYYYFEPIGVHKGRYERRELDEEVFGKKGIFTDVFYSGKGWLCDDATHWMPIEYATVFPPDRPRDR